MFFFVYLEFELFLCTSILVLISILVVYNYKFIPEVKNQKKNLIGKGKTLRAGTLTIAEVAT